MQSTQPDLVNSHIVTSVTSHPSPTPSSPTINSNNEAGSEVTSCESQATSQPVDPSLHVPPVKIEYAEEHKKENSLGKMERYKFNNEKA